jgi:hypothetical protein
MKNNLSPDTAVKRQGSAVGESIPFEQHGKPIAIDAYVERSGMHSHNPLVAPLQDPRPICIQRQFIQAPSALLLEDLLYFCMNQQTFLPSTRSAEIYQVSNDLIAAHVLFTRGSCKLGGAFCERAFKSMHIVANPLSYPNIFFTFLATHELCPHREVITEAWKYLAEYAAAKSGLNDPLQRLFRGLSSYIQDHGLEPYRDLVAAQMGNEICKHKQHAGGGFPFFPTYFFDVVKPEPGIAEDSRSYKLASRFAIAVRSSTKGSSSDAMEPMVSRNWNRLAQLHAVGHQTGWEHVDVLSHATALLHQATLSGPSGVYFEAAATSAMAKFHRARWDGSMASNHPRHDLARFYLEKSIDASARCSEPMDGSFLENLIVLEEWQREAGCVKQAEAASDRRQSWLRERSLLLKCDV